MFYPNAFRPDLKILNLNIKTGTEFTSLDDSEDILTVLAQERNITNVHLFSVQSSNLKRFKVTISYRISNSDE